MLRCRPATNNANGRESLLDWSRFNQLGHRNQLSESGAGIEREAALAIYEEAYFQFLAKHSDVVDWICEAAAVVYDIAPSNVESGCDYNRQECSAVHLQDIAVRCCLKRLGWKLEGDHLVQIRGHETEGFRLNPGQVTFHQRERIVKPSLSRTAWWNEDSVEEFWQSNTFAMCDYELGRNEVVYTQETMKHVQQQLSEEFGNFQLFNVRGSDTITRMLNWKSLPSLLEATQIVPVRPGADPWKLFGQYERFRLHSGRFRIMYRQYEDGLSSSQVRRQVQETGMARYLVPPEVEQFIMSNSLYV